MAAAEDAWFKSELVDTQKKVKSLENQIEVDRVAFKRGLVEHQEFKRRAEAKIKTAQEDAKQAWEQAAMLAAKAIEEYKTFDDF